MVKVTEVNEDFIERMEVFRQSPEGASFWESCSNNVVVFAEKCFDIRLRAWQVSTLSRITDPERVSKFFVLITSRQIGKSLSSAIVSSWAVLFNKFPGGVENNTAVCIISAGETESQKLLNEIKKLFKRGDNHLKRSYVDDEGVPLFGEHFFTELLDPDGSNNKTMMTLLPHDPEVHGEYILAGSKSGSTIVSYTPTSRVLGETFSLIIVDEAGKTDRITDEFFYEFLLPTGDERNAVFMILSTPWVSSGFYYRMVDPEGLFEPMEDAEVFAFDIDAIKIEDPQGHARRLKQIKKLEADGKIDEVQRAYYCRFVSSEQNYFDPEKVYQVFSPVHKKLFSYDGSCMMGVDFGAKSHSRTVITISRFDEERGFVYRIYDKVYEVNEDEDIVEDIAYLLTLFNVDCIVYDDADTGRYVVQQMEKKGWNIHPMSFRAEKVKKYGALRGLLNTGKLVSYEDEDLKVEMLALQNTPKRARSLIGAPPGYYDDRIDSWVCSAYHYLEVLSDDYEFFSLDKPKPVKKESVNVERSNRIVTMRKQRNRSKWFGEGF
jgi:hypothetical protein